MMGIHESHNKYHIVDSDWNTQYKTNATYKAENSTG